MGTITITTNVKITTDNSKIDEKIEIPNIVKNLS